MMKVTTRRSIRYIMMYVVPAAIMIIFNSCTLNSSIQMHVIASHDLNTNVYNQSAPVILKTYQLTDTHAFENANYLDLINNPYLMLSKNLIKIETYQIRPDQKQQIYININPKSHYIGLLAEYRIQDNNASKKIVSITDIHHKGITIYLHSNNIELIK